jgi:isoleucyl-tRNA synthetase
VKVVEGSYDPVALEKRVATFWKKNKTFRMVVESRRGGKIWAFLEGPPTMNGFMHVGHARGRTMKDVVLRFKTMQGYDVWRQGGWDCQGLPVELEVEKKLGTRTKKEIEEKIGLEQFVHECKVLVDYYLAHWREASERLGLWLDYDNAYETRRDRYIEFGWWTLKRADERGLLVEDFKVVPVCPRCETSLSGHEVAQGYSRVKDPSIYVKLRLDGGESEFIVVWTTTPWTIPGDEAVTVHPSYEYARVRVGGETWIVAKQLVDRVMKELGLTAYSVVDVVKGKDLAGRKYVHPLLDEVPSHKEHRGRFDHAVICGEHVTLEEGTGCVHTAPAHGPDDFAMGKELGLPIFCPVDMSGHFTKSGGKYTGRFVKEAEHLILEDLRRKGLLLRSGGDRARVSPLLEMRLPSPLHSR